MNYPHTAQIIYQAIINVLHEYNLKRDLENNIFSISFDNASNNIKSIDYFTRALNPIMDGIMFHQKCACHILSLTVNAGLKTTSVNNLIYKFKDGLHHINHFHIMAWYKFPYEPYFVFSFMNYAKNNMVHACYPKLKFMHIVIKFGNKIDRLKITSCFRIEIKIKSCPQPNARTEKKRIRLIKRKT
jgi:hypothetical protein